MARGRSWSARKMLRCASIVGALVSASCLVTNKVEFEQNNVPPHLVPIAPTSNFERLPSRPDDICKTGDEEQTEGDWMAFRSRVSDPNVGDPLEWRLLVNGVVSDLGSQGESRAVDRDEISACAKRQHFNRPCNKVQLLVTRRFSFGSAEVGRYFDTDEPGDLTVYEWTVLANAQDIPTADVFDCEVVPDGGVP